jgi:rhodanese-related sulfurtransferase
MRAETVLRKNRDRTADSEGEQSPPGGQAGPSADDGPCDPNWEVTPRAVRRMQKRNEPFLLLDCRTPEEEALASLEGGRLVPMQELSLHIDDLREHQDAPVVVYCHTGRRSLTVTRVLRQCGFRDVRSMAGGIERWSIEVDPDVPRY